MCLAVPMLVKKVYKGQADVELDGVTQTVNLMLVRDIKINDYVVVHAGYAIKKLNLKEAQATQKLWREFADNS